MSDIRPQSTLPVRERPAIRASAAALASRSRGARRQRTRDSALAKLLTFAFHPAFDSDHSIAEVLFWGNLIRDASTPSCSGCSTRKTPPSSTTPGSCSIGKSTAPAPSPISSSQESRRQAFRRPSASSSDGWRDASLRLYEVESVERGTGRRTCSISGPATRLFVIERTATAQMVTWDLLGARVAPDGLGGHVFEGGLYLYPADLKDDDRPAFPPAAPPPPSQFPFDDADDVLPQARRWCSITSG